MLKNIRKYSVIAALFIAGLSMTWQQVQAELTPYKAAELATAAFRGVGSSLKHRFKDDETSRAHFIRIVISASRLAHNVLLVKNHPNDYQRHYFADQLGKNNYLNLSMMIDSIDVVANVIAFTGSLFGGDGYPALCHRSDLDNEYIEYIQKYLLPACESCAALYLAVSDDYDVQNQKKRFIARNMLSLTSSLHDFLQQKGTGKITTGLFILVQLLDDGYQLFDNGSDFNLWLARRAVDQAGYQNYDVEMGAEPAALELPVSVVVPQVQLNPEQRQEAREARLVALRRRGIRV